jgi:DHA1 family bicyclomycin/chloramphenicol resistance-like MFS transporter
MLPALGDMASDLRISSGNQRQWIITALFLGLAAGHLIFGPFSDAVGRRPAIVSGIGIFVAGSAVCALASSFEVMMIGRLVQGIGAAGPRIGTVALIRDRFAGTEMARLMSVIMGVFIMVPVLAPLVGQGLLFLIPWRGFFGMLSAVSLGGGLWLLLRQPETLAEPRSLRLASLLAASWEVLTSVRPMAYTLAGGCCYGALMGYINSSQQLFQDLFVVGDLYALVFGASAAFISAATLVNARLVRRYGMERICIAAVAALVVWSVLFLVVLRSLGTPPTLRVWMLYNCPVLFLLGLTFGDFNAIALRELATSQGSPRPSWHRSPLPSASSLRLRSALASI